MSVDQLSTVTFTDLGGTTEMTFHQAAFIHDSHDSHDDGWSRYLDRRAADLSEVAS